MCLAGASSSLALRAARHDSLGASAWSRLRPLRRRLPASSPCLLGLALKVEAPPRLIKGHNILPASGGLALKWLYGLLGRPVASVMDWSVAWRPASVASCI